MAFPIPSHLPRKKDNDVSTVLLSKISETTAKQLTYELASSWASELDQAVSKTKEQIHERVQTDLPAFEKQLASSKSVQERLQTLSSNVDRLSNGLSDPESGLIPKLIMKLTQHATLAQEVCDSDVNYNVVSYLARCKQSLADLTSLANQGNLPEAVDKCENMDKLLAEPSAPLSKAKVMTDLKRRFRVVKDRTQEQLNDAYSRSIVISPSEIIVHPSVQVRQSETVLALSSIMSSLSVASLSSHMATLRRDIITYYINRVVEQPFSVVVTSVLSDSEHKLSLFPAPPNDENLTARIENLSSILTFLNKHLVPHLPPHTSFSQSLCGPLTNAILDKLLAPSLPSSHASLPPFLALVHRAVEFEKDFINDAQEVKSWADAIGAHYERKRRVELLERARVIILREEKFHDVFRAEISSLEDSSSHKILGSPSAAAPKPDTIMEETTWGFDDDPGDGTTAEEDGWGFDDDTEPAAEEASQEPSSANGDGEPAGEDPGDAWGWNDDEPSPTADEDTSTDSSAWDDPWGEEPAEPKPQVVPKAATRLEKLSGKGKTAVSPMQSPIPVAAPPPTPAMPSSAKQQQSAVSQPPQPVPEKESYLVSGRAKELLFLVEDVLREATELSASGVLPQLTSHSPTGSVISQAASLLLDLYRGLYPVAFSPQLASSKRSMSFSNDCLWLSEEIARAASTGSLSGAEEKLGNCAKQLKLLGDSWYEDTIDNQCEKVNDILDGAEGFVETAQQDRFDECESAVSEVLKDIRGFAQQIKTVLTKSKFYVAIGAVVDSALSRILQDVLALPDIPEVESHKLSELCRILNSLEGLFVEDPNHPSFVVAYVPSWLKFSYLSELLEASIADISYLFEEGALVDFDIEELIQLVRALFADTPLRMNTINKLMQGHPLRS